MLNAERGVLNVNGVLYQKTVSPLSGVVMDYPSLYHNKTQEIDSVYIEENLTVH